MMKKNRRRTKYTKRTVRRKSPKLQWMLLGILIGLSVPAIIYFKSRISFTNELSKTISKKKPAIEHLTYHKNNSYHSDNKQYDFYNLLSSQEDNTSHDTDKGKQKNQNKKYLLKIASFKKYIQADQLKAQLLLIGIDNVKISKSIEENSTFYKVIVGPFDNKIQTSQVQNQLNENNITSVLDSPS